MCVDTVESQVSPVISSHRSTAIETSVPSGSLHACSKAKLFCSMRFMSLKVCKVVLPPTRLTWLMLNQLNLQHFSKNPVEAMLKPIGTLTMCTMVHTSGATKALKSEDALLKIKCNKNLYLVPSTTEQDRTHEIPRRQNDKKKQIQISEISQHLNQQP